MTRQRNQNDGLPHRVYEYRGKKKYSIGYKGRNNVWLFRFDCPIGEARQIQALRRDAMRRALAIGVNDQELETINQLIDSWFDWQDKLPASSTRKRAESTVAENRREARQLREVFGDMAISDLKPVHAYGYLDKCETLQRGPKANKEIGLLKAMMTFAIRRGVVDVNPVEKLEMLPVQASNRYVSDLELELAMAVGRKIGGPQHIAALALQTAYLCVRRSVEVRDLKREDVREDGILWENKKSSASDFKRKVLIEWSPDLRNIINEALSIERKTGSAGSHIFGNLDGQKYTKGGWKSTLGRLMEACVNAAVEKGVPFKPFSLQDLRPKGVSDKLATGQTDVIDATLHTNERMVRQVYDRRRQRSAQPTK